jgi:hypothetical protein
MNGENQQADRTMQSAFLDNIAPKPLLFLRALCPGEFPWATPGVWRRTRLGNDGERRDDGQHTVVSITLSLQVRRPQIASNLAGMKRMEALLEMQRLQRHETRKDEGFGCVYLGATG